MNFAQIKIFIDLRLGKIESGKHPEDKQKIIYQIRRC